MKTTAIHIHAHGGPEVLTLASVDVGDPAPGELRIRQSAIGLNLNPLQVQVQRPSSSVTR